MKRVLVKAILIIAEAGIHLLVERIKKKRMKKDGSYRRLDHFPFGCGAYGVRDRSAAHSATVGCRRAMRKSNARRRSISKG